MRLESRLVEARELTARRRGEMFGLVDRYYEHVRRDVFDADLASKPWVILLFRAGTQALCGFSTQALLDIRVVGRPVKALFSGDTIIEPDCWGDPALSGAWGR